MNYAIISRGDEKSNELEVKIKEELHKMGYTPFNNDEVLDVVVSIGGDGTLLRCVQKYQNYDPLYVTINTGHFGYLCEYGREEVDLLFRDLKSREKLAKRVPLLECNLIREEEVYQKMYAVNEFRIHSAIGNTLKFDVNIDDTFFETLKADGCLIASSLGSSGIAKSLHGALIDNEIELLEFIEVAPISNNGYMSLNTPFVLNKDKVFKLSNFSQPIFNIYFDSEHYHIYDFKKDDIIKIFLSEKHIRILTNKDKNYIKRTSNMFIR